MIAAIVLIALGVPAVAQARPGQDVFFEAPRDLTSSWVTPAIQQSTFERLDSLGVKALRVNLAWSAVAPASDKRTRPTFDARNPASYAWGNFGSAIDRARQLGWKVLISPSSPVPKWATRAKADHVTRPSASEFELFTTAAARRFGGPQAMWSIWNEPNLPRFLKPQVVGGKPMAGRLYRKLYQAGRRGIEAGGQPEAKVLFGETAPVGLARDGRLRPIAFLRNAFCVTRSYKKKKGCKKLNVDGIAHHPYRSIQGVPRNKDDVTYQVIGRLTRALDRIAKAGATQRRRPVYLTEFGIQSWPDKLFGVSQQKQLEERARAERKAYGNARVRGFSQYLLTDDDPTGKNRWNGFETGLIDHTGKTKRAYDGFRLVLDARPKGKKRVSLWGLVRPAEGRTTVRIERKTRRAKRYSHWKTLRTSARGTFSTTDRRRDGVRYRYRWTSPSGERMTAPAVRVFRDV